MAASEYRERPSVIVPNPGYQPTHARQETPLESGSDLSRPIPIRLNPIVDDTPPATPVDYQLVETILEKGHSLHIYQRPNGEVFCFGVELFAADQIHTDRIVGPYLLARNQDEPSTRKRLGQDKNLDRKTIKPMNRKVKIKKTPAPRRAAKWLRIEPKEEKRGWGRKHDHDKVHDHGRDRDRGRQNGTKPAVYVQTPRGKIQGYVATLAGKNPVNVFEGVPFAEPPVGKLRFKEIQSKRPWRQTWNATFYRPACMSNTSHTRSPQNVISEDCLYVNIFADQRCSKKNPCPVIHYIHGGGFYYDSAVMFNDTFIIEKYASDGVVFVIAAYRLGVFGFLDLGDDKVVTRNLGLHDIVYGIIWVRREIKRFGGDPQKITLMGNSAGASTILYLSVAPGVPKGLWSQVVISSGGPDLVGVNNRNITRQVIELSGCLYDNSTDKKDDDPKNKTLSKRESVYCLRKVDAISLLGYQRELEDDQNAKFLGPSIDEKLFKGEGYNELLSKWKAVPSIIGNTKCEFDDNESGEPMVNVCANYPRWFNYTTDEVFEACIEHYSNQTEEDALPPAADAFHAEVYREGRVITQKGEKAYLYSFDLANHTHHSNDATFMIGIHLPTNWTEEETLMEKYYPEMIKRFVKTGDPDKEWKPMDKDGKNYFVLDFTLYHETLFGPYLVEEPYYEDGTRFWLQDLADVEYQALHQNISPVYNESGDVIDANATIPIFSLKSIVLNGTDGIDLYNETEDDPYTDPSLNDLYSLLNDLDTEDEAVGEAWGAFWVSLSLCMILASIILVMVVSRVIYRFKNTKGYYYNDDHGIFTEKTKIVTMNGMRYYT